MTQKKPDHTLTLMNRREAPYMDFIRSGAKHAEGRVHYPMFDGWKAGETVLFHNRHEGIVCRIDFLHPYPNFEAMLRAEGPDRMLPQLHNPTQPEEATIKQGINIYQAFPNASRVTRLGCIAIGVTYLHDWTFAKRASQRKNQQTTPSKKS